ncbi:MAG: protein kinase [Spirulinaceae cyanobacterium SM2_1_0]|nr:protein kinase [Spirulinaceae cyanobacterium SM2_1_0]
MTYCLNVACSNPHNADTAEYCLACGTRLRLKERYCALQPLGQGGFGRTFRGLDQHRPGQPVCVIKQFHCTQVPDAAIAKAQSLFAQEAIRLSELGAHPQIPTLLAHFEQDQQFYLIQEFIDGLPLSAVSWQARGNTEAQLWQLLRDLLPVLDYIHARQVIHRDIKPENIMQRRDGRFVLIDFGIARVLTQTALMGNATVVGTPGFMAPEQMRGKVLPASDLYSLGATCLNLLTGANPDELYDVVSERWQWRDRLPPDLKLSPRAIAVLNQLVAPSLRQRAQSARAVLRELGSLATDPSPPISHPATATTPVTNQPTRILTPQASATPPPQLEPDNSVQEVDWLPLQQALKRQQWQLADEITGALLCELAGKPTGSYLPNGEIAKLPDAGLKILDQLWVQYSQGQFGLSVQAKIYVATGEQYPLFCDRVGWPVHSPTHHRYLQFNRRAPQGHLPSRRWLGGTTVWQHMKFLVPRLQACGLL